MIFLEILAIIVLAAGFITLTVKFLIPRALILLGGVDSWWSPLRTLPPPGEMYILVRGSRTGPFDSVIESVLDYQYSSVNHEFEGPGAFPRPDDYLSNLGVIWVGFFRYLFYREVRHDRWEKLPPPSTEWGIVSKIRSGPSIFFRYNMASQIKGAETIGNFPVDAVIVFTAQIVNPVKAFFFAGGWEVQTTAAVQGIFRKYVSNRRIEDLRIEQRAGVATPVVDEIKSLGGRDPSGAGNHDPAGLYALFGVEITDARFVLFDLVAGDTAMTNAVRGVEIANLNAEAAARRGEGEKREREARAAGVRAEVQAWLSIAGGETIAMAEAIKEAKPTVIGGGVIASIDTTKKVTPP